MQAKAKVRKSGAWVVCVHVCVHVYVCVCDCVYTAKLSSGKIFVVFTICHSIANVFQ